MIFVNGAVDFLLLVAHMYTRTPVTSQRSDDEELAEEHTPCLLDDIEAGQSFRFPLGAPW